mmetsp:Transcript_42557/g.106218  ORF Transcript_42557/g.106218 Transcript_42557/m.106218 type:complete len:307 (+) Transcript_42557:3078-3998(+)
MARKQFLDEVCGPFLEGLGQHRVVGVVEALSREVPCLVPVEPLDVDEEAHHLRDGDGRVGVVELETHLGRQLVPTAALLLLEPSEAVLDGGADEEVLLLQTQLLPLPRVVVGVEDGRDVLGTLALLDSVEELATVEGMEVKLLAGTRFPESEVDGVVRVESRDGVVVRHGLHDLAARPAVPLATLVVLVSVHVTVEPHGVGDVGSLDFPWVGGDEPVVRVLHLTALDDLLLEDAVRVPDAVAPDGIVERGHGVEEAGSQTAQTAIAQRRVVLVLIQLLQVVSDVCECLLVVGLDVQIHQRVLHRPS